MDNSEIKEAASWLGALFGAGGITAIVVAWIGTKKPPAVTPAPRATPVEIESPWLIQNLTRMQMDIEAIKDSLDVTNNRISGIASLLKRRQKRKPNT